MKRAIKINAKENKLEEVMWEGLKDLQAHVGGYIERVETCMLPKHSILIDEEGLFKGYDYCFLLRGYPDPRVGNGLIVADNGQEFVSTTISLKKVADVVQMPTVAKPKD